MSRPLPPRDCSAFRSPPAQHMHTLTLSLTHTHSHTHTVTRTHTHTAHSTHTHEVVRHADHPLRHFESLSHRSRFTRECNKEGGTHTHTHTHKHARACTSRMQMVDRDGSEAGRDTSNPQKHQLIDTFTAQRNLLYECSTITSTIQSCSNLRCPRARNWFFAVGVPREQKLLKGHLPRVIYHQVY